jgi:hypothetical protein
MGVLPGRKPWDTAPVSYHEAFWIVVGTGAPVVALAAVVALPDTSGMHEELIQISDKLKSPMLPTWAIASKSIRYIAAAIRWGAIGDVILQAGLLTISLMALAYERDIMPPWAAIVLIVVGILILALIMAAMSGFRNGPTKNAREAAGHGTH